MGTTLADLLLSYHESLQPPVREMRDLWQAQKPLLLQSASADNADIGSVQTGIEQLENITSQLSINFDKDDRHIMDNIDLTSKTIRHDLRTPINAILGYSEILLEDLADTGSSEACDGLNAVITKTKFILSLIDGFKIGTTSNELVMDASNANSLLQPNTQLAAENSLAGKILVVDDIATNRAILQRRLETQGYVVRCASSGEEAIKGLEHGKFDLILLDMIMPGMNGYEVLKHIKSDSLLRDIPVIVISAMDDMKNVIACIEAGAEDYLHKPFDPVLLRARIGSSIEKKRLRDEANALIHRLEGELEDAQKAQLNMVPNEFHVATTGRPYTVYGYMCPAREVGGDFYDFILVDDEQLWFVVGDVSDKGAASGMFMARTVSLLRLILQQHIGASTKPITPDAALAALNAELCEFNSEMTFVTVLLARLNIRTGALCMSNAGHAAPFLLGNSVGVQMLESPRGRPLGIRTDSSYHTSEFNLTDNQTVFLFSDGVTDAQSESGEHFSENKLTTLLSKVVELPPKEILHSVDHHVAEFVGSAVQFDDITMLAMRWAGWSITFEDDLAIENSSNGIDMANKWIQAIFEQQNFPNQPSADLYVVFDEVLSNIVKYAYNDDKLHEIKIGIRACSDHVVLSFADDGIAFDPVSYSSAIDQRTVEERNVGGLGVRFIKELTDTFTYTRSDGCNCLEIRKNFNVT